MSKIKTNINSIRIRKYQFRLAFGLYFQLIILLILLLTISCTYSTKKRNQVNTSSSALVHDTIYKRFPIQRGINISHWLSQSSVQGPARRHIFTKRDVEFLSDLGFDHLRIPIDEEHLWNELDIKQTESFQLLHNAIKWCIKNDLRVVLDLHQIRSHSFNNKENNLWKSMEEKMRFVSMWIQLSNEFIKYNVDYVAYELLNEAVADNPADWNELVAITLDSLRKKEPCRKIIIGSNRWQSSDTFHDLVVPENDKNIILSFHFYTPFIFTHYRTYWTDIGEYKGLVKYPGKIVDEENLINYDEKLKKEIQKYNGYYIKDTLLKHIQEPIKYANNHGLQLYCGEFGCMPTVRRVDRLKWYSDVREILEANNIAWASWDYKGAFSIYNLQNGYPDEKLISVLLGSFTN